MSDPAWQKGNVTLYLGDCLDILRQMPANSIDALVTDPPAGIGFMGKEWDHDKGGRDAWVSWLSGVMRECLRVLKPGAHALVWALPRTSHWTGWALEEAGFEVRDRIAHLFGSGFPKSLDVSKAIDKMAGAERTEVIGKGWWPSQTKDKNTYGDYADCYQPGIGQDANRKAITAPATPAAIQWQGWGTALKPACEDWWLCRKPLAEGTIAANVLEWGTGAINVDGCRVPTNGNGDYNHWRKPDNIAPHQGFEGKSFAMGRRSMPEPHPVGRFPANVTHDGSEEVLAGFPVTNGTAEARRGWHNGRDKSRCKGTEYGHETLMVFGDSSSAARFFYSAKCSRSDRNEGIEGVTLELEVCLCGANMEQVMSLERAISEYVTVRVSQGCNMTSNGNGPTDLYHRVTLSITSTETSKTIESKTWSASTSLPTSEFIAGAIRTLWDNGSNLVGTVDSISQSLISMNAKAASAHGAKIVVSETPWRISASARPMASDHPTMKPTPLMRWLCRLITPPGGTVLDPFMGSGSTGKAAMLEGFGFIGIELDLEYFEIAKRRIEHVANQARQLELSCAS